MIKLQRKDFLDSVNSEHIMGISFVLICTPELLDSGHWSNYYFIFLMHCQVDFPVENLY